jgi:hypothetical protein
MDYYGFTTALLLGPRFQHLREGPAGGRKQGALHERAARRRRRQRGER